MSSNAVAQNRIASTIGDQLASGNFQTVGSNLPHINVILGEANTANQSALSTNPMQITSANQAGTLYGFGSPIHSVARILFPLQGGGTNAAVWVYPQASSGAVASVKTITITATPTAGGQHYVNVGGRNNVDGAFYSINVVSTDTATTLAVKVAASINNVTACPYSATSSAGVVTLTAKWTGLTTEAVTLTVDTSLAPSIGVTYVVAESTAGTGTPSIAASLALFSTQWNTEVINCYGTDSTTLALLETFNGVPGITGSTGRYLPTTFKPFIAFTGSVLDDPSSLTSGRSTQNTIAICPAPQSQGMHYEAAANMAVLFSNICISTPHLDVMELTYPDMPLPLANVIPSMQDYNFRDTIVKLGCSTVVIEKGVYKVKDFITTNNDGTPNPQYSYCRNLDIDWNVEYGIRQIQQNNVLGFAIAGDNDVISATNVIKPKQLRALISNYADQLVLRALIVDASFTKKSIVVTLNSGNPNRLDSSYNYKRSGTARIISSTAYAGFNFGTV